MPSPTPPPVSIAPIAAVRWPTRRQFGTMLALMILAAFPELLTLKATFVHRDFGTFTYPLAFYHRECFWRGELPLWNPFHHCGIPFLAQWNTLALYPPTLIYLLLPLEWSLGLFCVAHLFFGGLGMYSLARRWTGHPFAASVAGATYVFSALALHSLMWSNNIAALGWMPWVVLLVERGWREGGARLVSAVLAGAMQMLAGAPEIILMTWLLLVALLVGEWIDGFRSRKDSTLRFLGMIALVAGISAFQLLPFLEFISHTQRNPSFSDSKWAMPWWGLANYLVPLFGSFPGSLGVYAQQGQYWVNSYYPGMAAILCAAWTLWRARTLRIRVLAFVAGISVLLAMGTDGYVYAAIMKIFPPLGAMRYPIKFVVLPAFILPLLAAFAIPILTARAAEGRKSHVRPLYGLCLALTLVIAALLAYAHEFHFVSTAWTTIVSSGASRVMFLLAAATFLWYASQVRSPSAQRLAQGGFLLLIWADVLTAAPRPNPTVENWVYERNLAARQLNLNPRPALGESRIMLSFAAESALNTSPLDDPRDYYLYHRMSLASDCNVMDAVPSVSGFYSLYTREWEQISYLLYFHVGTPPPALLDFLSVSHVPTPKYNLKWTARPTALPCATAGQQPVFADVHETLRGLTATNFNPRRTVYLPTEARGIVPATNNASARILSGTWTDRQISLEVESNGPGLLVLSQSYYPCWKASADGQPTRIWRANHAFQAIEVPSGRSQVILAYRDNALWLGAALSIISLGLCAFLWRRGTSALIAPDVSNS